MYACMYVCSHLPLKHLHFVAPAVDPCRSSIATLPSMGDPSSDSSGVAQPAVLQLAELNQRSASLGSWDIGIFAPEIHEWTYTQKHTQQKIQGAAFRCLLVSLTNPSHYAKGEIPMRSNRREPLEQAKKKLAENKCFRMSAVHFQSNCAQEYLHAPLKFVVDLSRTKLDPLLSKEDGQVIQAQPSLTLSEINELQQNQRFDVTALVEKVSDPRPTQNNRIRRHIQIIDQSDSKVQVTTWTFWTDAVPSKEHSAMIDILRTVEGTARPLAFFALTGKKSGQGFSIENSNDFFIVEATSDRASKLTTIALQLHETPAEEREVLQVGFGSGRSYADEQGRETFCKMLTSMERKTDIRSIDEEATLWQLNWAEIAWPEGSESDLLTKDGRLFFLTDVRDITGPGPKVRVNEASALALAQVSSKEEFLELHAAGKQSFPVMATVKILREVTRREVKVESGGSHSAQQGHEYINFTVVNALDQPLQERPTQATLELLPLMPHVEHDSACILPSALQMVKACSHYAFQVRASCGAPTSPLLLPCQKIISLVKSTKPSTPHPLGAGFKVVTRDIEDMLGDDLNDSPSATTPKFVLSSTCTLENLTSYKLDPPRGGTQHALVTITGKIDDVFVVDQVQLLDPGEAAEAKRSLSQLLHLAVRIYQKDSKRNCPWDNNMSPVQAKRCRVLGRSPTGPPIEGNSA